MTRDMLGNARLAGLVLGAFLGAVNLAYIDEAVAFEGDGFSSAKVWSPRAVGVGEWSVLVPMATGDQPEDGLELAIRMVKREVASRSPELVTVSRTLAGDQFEERIRTLSAAFVTGAVVSQKERMIAGRPYLEVVVKAVVDQIPSERIAEALASDRVRATRLRLLEGEVARLEAVLAGIPPDEKQEEVNRTRRRAALDALLASETEIRQTFLADGLTGQKLRAGRRVEAAAEVFERDIVSSALATETDARIEHASFATEEERREFRRRDRAIGHEPVVALTKVFWALPNELEHYSKILGRWFRVMGATATPDYVVVPGGQARGSQGICVGANDGRKEFPEAAELFEYMKGRSINLQVEVAFDRETEGREERKGFDVQIAGVFNGGTHWCLFDSPREAAALPFRSQPGVYAFSRGAALSAEHPYRLLMSEEESKAVSHVSVSVVDQGMPREK